MKNAFWQEVADKMEKSATDFFMYQALTQARLHEKGSDLISLRLLKTKYGDEIKTAVHGSVYRFVERTNQTIKTQPGIVVFDKKEATPEEILEMAERVLEGNTIFVLETEREEYKAIVVKMQIGLAVERLALEALGL